MEAIYRLAEKSDIDILVGFVGQFYAIDNYPFDEKLSRTLLGRLVDDPSLGRVWLIELESKAVGYMVLAFGYSLEYHGRDAFLDELFIEESQRGQGLGTQFITFLESACRDLGIQALHLEVERTNRTAQQVYRKAGFTDQDRLLLTKWIQE